MVVEPRVLYHEPAHQHGGEEAAGGEFEGGFHLEGVELLKGGRSKFHRGKFFSIARAPSIDASHVRGLGPLQKSQSAASSL